MKAEPIYPTPVSVRLLLTIFRPDWHIRSPLSQTGKSGELTAVDVHLSALLLRRISLYASRIR